MHTRVAVLVVTVLLAAACSSERMPDTEPERALLTELPERCAGLGPAPVRGQVTFVAQGRAFGASGKGTRARCIAEGIGSGTITWGAAGDRFLLGDAGGPHVYLPNAFETIAAPGPDASLQGLSRPEGTQVVFVAGSGEKLVKIPAEGGPRNDISFLARHDEAVYHPSGTHVAVVGEDRDGNYGIFLATNEGKDARQLVAVEDALEVYEPVFSHDGDTMYYVADHGGRWDLHSFSLSSTPNAATEEQLQTLAGFRRKIDHITVDPFDGSAIAYRVGDCEPGFRTFAHIEDASLNPVNDAGDTDPVGWLPNGDLIVAESDDACADDPAVDLYRAWLGGENLLVSGVHRPSVRAVLPPLPIRRATRPKSSPDRRDEAAGRSPRKEED